MTEPSIGPSFKRINNTHWAYKIEHEKITFVHTKTLESYEANLADLPWALQGAIAKFRVGKLKRPESDGTA
jgi:uncharacterized protein (DUF2132 family)